MLVLLQTLVISASLKMCSEIYKECAHRRGTHDPHDRIIGTGINHLVWIMLVRTRERLSLHDRSLQEKSSRWNLYGYTVPIRVDTALGLVHVFTACEGMSKPVQSSLFGRRCSSPHFRLTFHLLCCRATTTLRLTWRDIGTARIRVGCALACGQWHWTFAWSGMNFCHQLRALEECLIILQQ